MSLLRHDPDVGYGAVVGTDCQSADARRDADTDLRRVGALVLRGLEATAMSQLRSDKPPCPAKQMRPLHLLPVKDAAMGSGRLLPPFAPLACRLDGFG